MAAMKARVLYDFDGDVSNSELTIRENDVISVLNQDVGEGWWEGTDSYGNRGLFPAAYVEVLEDAPPSRPPPLPPQQPTPPAAPYLNVTPPYGSGGYEGADGRADWDDEWDDRSSTSDTYSGDYNFQGGTAQRTTSLGRSATVRKSINRFSKFVQSGGEAFLLGVNADAPIQQKDRVVVIEGTESPEWESNPTPFVVNITEPEKKSKYKGIKSYVAYSITPTVLLCEVSLCSNTLLLTILDYDDIRNHLKDEFDLHEHTGQAVSHRFKHFDWLYGRLMEKFPCLSVPPIPDKQITGRYAEEFIEKRRQLLETWMNRVARHPVLAQSEVFQHFVTCDSETREKEWKVGKRKAECDKVVGSQFFNTIDTPTQKLSQHQVEMKLDQFRDFVKGMDESVKLMMQRCEEHWDKVARSYRNEYKRLSNAFLGLSSSFVTDAAPYSLPLTQAIENTGKTYEDIGELCQEQPKKDISPMLDVLREYSGILSTFPDIIVVHKSALSKVKDCQKMQEEDKMEYTAVAEVTSRLDVVTNAMFAEFHHFQRERTRDYKAIMQLYIQEQIKFHQEIIDKLQASLNLYNHVPDD